jgi:DNA polymerase-3 subunit gamma/tau
MGRLLTKAINCDQNAATAADRPGEPCNACASCVAYNEGRALDLIELDGASNRGIEEIRKLRENAGYAPMAGEGAHKVYLIDEVHMLTDQAFNALLKTLEEPPPHIVFILATTDAHKVPATITSRCQRQDFKRIPIAAIADRLEHIAHEEQIIVPREGLEIIARSSTGSLRDANNLLEQICDSYGKEASVEAVRESLGLIADARAGLLATQALRGDLAAALATVSDVRDDGLDLRQFQKEVVAHLRDLLLVQAGALGEGVLTAEQVEEMRNAVADVPRDKLVQLLRLLSLADLKQDPLSTIPLELALAESLAPPAPAAAARHVPQAPARSAPQRSAPPTRAPEFSNRPPAPAPQPAPERVPPDLKKGNITGASAEDIARMVGSDAPVIPAASDQPDAPSTANGVASGPDLSTFVDQSLRPRMKESDPKLGSKLNALLNGSCHAISWQDGVLTLGFYTDGYQKKTVETEHRKRFEDVASQILGAPVSIRCIIAAKPPAKLATKSPLVQHAVENRGATIVENDS